jgi:VWFA-related protein
VRLLPLLAILALPPRLHAQQAAQPATPTIRAQARLVVVDVVVTDAKQNPIHNLKAADFTLLENNAPQQIKSFEEHAAPTDADIAKLPPMPKMLPGYFTNYTPAPSGGALNVLLLDTLNTPMDAQAYVRDQLLEYLKNAPPGAPIAIFGLTQRLILLQAFTSDPAVLKASVVARDKAEMSPLLDDPLNGTASESITDFMKGTTRGDPIESQMTAAIKQTESQHNSQQLETRALLTLTAMDQLARYLESMPGRKNLIWFSGSFPLSLMPDGELADPFAYVANFAGEYRETTNLLTRAQVAVYPIDARGIVTNTVHAASSGARDYSRTPHNFAKDQANFYNKLFSEHDTMQQMARDTGGRAFVDTDGLTKALGDAIASGASYYTLSYTPSDPRWNGKYRKIQIKLDSNRTATLAYRRGYYADDPDAPAKPGRESAASPNRPSAEVTAMTVAMMRGAPTPTEILLKTRILPAAGDPEPEVAKGNTLNPDPALKLKGPFRRILIDSEADPGALFFTTTPDGHHRCEVEFVTFVYNREGTVVDAIDTPAAANLTPERYAAILRSGLPFHQEISVPIQGEYFIRTAVHDMRTGRVGAVEVPVAAIANLPPLNLPPIK